MNAIDPLYEVRKKAQREYEARKAAMPAAKELPARWRAR